MRYGGRPKLTVGQQFTNLQICPLAKGTGEFKKGNFEWICDIQPTPLTRIYSTKFTFGTNKPPRVFIISPDIQKLAHGKTIPHVYRNPLRLCLFHPKGHKWDRSKLISKTIVPWTYMWLYYFEDWLSTGEWHGGGIHCSE